MYFIVVYWVWLFFGWLCFNVSYLVLGLGVIDFVGSGVVYFVGGFVGFWGFIIEGLRVGRFDVFGNFVLMRGYNVILVVLGIFLLWFGWFGFNLGSFDKILVVYSNIVD